MSNLNKCMFIGQLGAEPEIRYTGNGTAVCTFNIATNRPKRQGQEKAPPADWHRIVIFGQRGETAKEHLSKGRRVYVECRAQTRSWTDNDGNTRYTTEYICDNWLFMDSKNNSGNGNNPPPPTDDDVPENVDKEIEDLDDLPSF